MNKFFRSNTFYAILSVVIAVLLWVYVVYDVSPTYEMWIEDVPVNTINVSELFEDGSLAINGDNQYLLSGDITVDVKVKGKRSIVSSVSRKDISCTLDMITVSKAGTYSLKPNVEIEYSGVDIVASKPGSLKFDVENIKQRDINIELKTMGELPEGYSIENLRNRNTVVKVTGADSVIEKINLARIVLDYSTLEPGDSEKSIKIDFIDANGDPLDSSSFNKSVEYCKVTFGLYTTKEVSLVLTPKYEDEVKENNAGHKVVLSAVSGGADNADGGAKIKVKLRGTAVALEKYLQSDMVVYTEPIDVRHIYADKVLKDIKAAELSNDVDYVTIPTLDIKATVVVDE